METTVAVDIVNAGHFSNPSNIDREYNGHDLYDRRLDGSGRVSI